MAGRRVYWRVYWRVSGRFAGPRVSGFAGFGWFWPGYIRGLSWPVSSHSVARRRTSRTPWYCQALELNVYSVLLSVGYVDTQ